MYLWIFNGDYGCLMDFLSIWDFIMPTTCFNCMNIFYKRFLTTFEKWTLDIVNLFWSKLLCFRCIELVRKCCWLHVDIQHTCEMEILFYKYLNMPCISIKHLYQKKMISFAFPSTISKVLSIELFCWSNDSWILMHLALHPYSSLTEN